MLGPGSLPDPNIYYRTNIEQEVDDIAVPHHIFFALAANQTLCLSIWEPHELVSHNKTLLYVLNALLL